MTKEELIQHYEKEFEEYDNKAKSFENTNQVLYEWFNGSRVQIRNFLHQLKNLEALSESQSVSDNETKRKILIDFSFWFKVKYLLQDRKPCYTDVDDYLKEKSI